MISFELLEPWRAINQAQAEAFARELSAELSGGHPLFSVQVKAVAARQDRDDVLFLLESEAARCAVVHLTYANRPEKDSRWPRTKFFDSLEDWRVHRMQTDHDEFIA